MEGLRQVIGAIYVALCEAAGGDAVLRRANSVLQEVLDKNAVDDPIAVRVLEVMLEGLTPKWTMRSQIVRQSSPMLPVSPGCSGSSAQPHK